MTFQELENKTYMMSDLMSPNERMELYELARKCPSGSVIVEIGTWKGKSACWLAKGTEDGNKVKVYSVDLFIAQPLYINAGEDFYEEVLKNIKNTGFDITLIRGNSSEIDFNEPVGLIFIDGNHDYEQVEKDLFHWLPKVIKGGTIAFHDYGGPTAGPTLVVDKYIKDSPKFQYNNLVQTLYSAIKL